MPLTLKPLLDTLMIFILRVRKTNGPNIVSPVYTFIQMYQSQVVIKGDFIEAINNKTDTVVLV